MDVAFSTKDWTVNDEDLPTTASSLLSSRALSNTGNLPINNDSPSILVFLMLQSYILVS
jgi:hypothetical protein